jgi:hypothetical protein
MEPVQTEMVPNDSEFDLDIRLEPVAWRLSAEPAQKPASAKEECEGSNYTCCPGTCN